MGESMVSKAEFIMYVLTYQLFVFNSSYIIYKLALP